MAESAAVSHILGRGDGAGRRLRRHRVPQSALPDRRDHRHRRRRSVVARRDGVAAARGHRRQLRRGLVQDAGHPPRPLRDRRGDASCGRAGATPSHAGSPGSSPPMPASGRNCSSTGKAISPAISIPTCNGSRRCGARWSTASTPTRPTSGTPKRLHACGSQQPTCRSACRCSGTPGCRPPRSSCSTRWPPITISTCGCRTPATICGQTLAGEHGPVPRRDDTSHRNVGHPLLATLGRDLRELQRSLPADRRPTNTSAATTAPTRCSAGCSPTSPPTPFGRKAGRCTPTTARCRCTAATARPGRSTSCARCCSACSPTTRRWNPATSSSCARTSRPTRR